MADPNDYRPGDLSHTLLQKILARLRDTGTSGGSASEATLAQIKENGLVAAADADAAAAAIIATAAVTAAATASTAAAISATAGVTAASTAQTAALLAEVRDAIPASDPFFLEATTGLLNGKVAQTLHIKGRRAGFNAINIPQDIAEYLGLTVDLMTELTGSEAFEIVSSSASDSAAGVGVRTVRLTYIDASDNLVQSAPFTMNGVTAVPLTGITAHMLLWLQAVTGGTTEGAVGTILLRIAGGGATHDQISIGENRSLAGRFMVPVGFTGYVRYWQVSTIGGATFDTRLKGTVNLLDRTITTRYATQFHAFAEAGQAIVSDLPWVKFPALSKIKLSTTVSAAGAANRIHSDFSVMIVAD